MTTPSPQPDIALYEDNPNGHRQGWAGRKYNKGRLFTHNSLDSLVGVLEDTANHFEDVNQLKGNFTTPSTGRFGEIFCGF